MSKAIAISYKDVQEKFIEEIPDIIIETVNNLILKNFEPSNERSLVYQEDILNATDKAGLSRDEIFDKHWLDIELLYEQQGWDVDYFDSPKFAWEDDGNFKTYFEFKKKVEDYDEY